MRPRLRFMTCGSVDDGKSTLLGRLLHDSGAVLDDELDALKAASRKCGQDDLDLSPLLDGLDAERVQGITIDASYRYFSTANRAFIAADAPGHEHILATWRPPPRTASLPLFWLTPAWGC